jgi:hypothetical protein
LRTTLKDFIDPLCSPIPREDGKTTKIAHSQGVVENLSKSSSVVLIFCSMIYPYFLDAIHGTISMCIIVSRSEQMLLEQASKKIWNRWKFLLCQVKKTVLL